MTLIGITLLHLLEGSQLCILFLSSLLLHKTILTYSVFLSKPFYDKVLLFSPIFTSRKRTWVYPISAVYSFPLPVSSGNIPGIPDVSPFRWGLPAPSESPENKIWPVTACFPVSGTYPCLSLLMKNLPEQSRRILPAYWHLETLNVPDF